VGLSLAANALERKGAEGLGGRRGACKSVSTSKSQNGCWSAACNGDGGVRGGSPKRVWWVTRVGGIVRGGGGKHAGGIGGQQLEGEFKPMAGGRKDQEFKKSGLDVPKGFKTPGALRPRRCNKGTYETMGKRLRQTERT